MNIIYTIARYEKLSNENFLVAFNIKDGDSDSFYIECILPLSDISAKTTTEVCQLAFDNVKNKIEQIIRAAKDKQNY